MLGRTERENKILDIVLSRRRQLEKTKYLLALSTYRLQNTPYENPKNDVCKGRFYLPFQKKSVSMQILKDEIKAHNDSESVLDLLYSEW
uniref:Ubiquitin-fold modifier 1 n=1 Tax=Pan troglodytes TaxID=9598 RepID=K7CDS5_PANTR